MTRDVANKRHKYHLHVDLTQGSALYSANMIKMWLSDSGIKILNVAGPRASGDPDIYDGVVKVLELVFKDRK